ncbi:endothelin-converting enzyme 1 [Aplysia californica]|uniref:Endothelin-converting enzyme 1 n=1 Tax=Aplysia californica TaxID=6500 RepID=A0ABM1AB85_APLCA|nr:endothelin-converting enzyme 1 [Aplysia californica]
MGGETYKEFDSASIITNTTEGTVTIRNHTFRKRELLLGVIAVFAFLLVIVLAIVLAVEVGTMKNEEATAAAQMTSTGCDSGTCLTPACLRASLYHKQTMNEAVDPCQNFYAFACGGYAEANPQDELLDDVTPSHQVLMENTERLVYLLESEPDRQLTHAYEKKLRDFMYSCSNHFDKMDLRGYPFIHHVVSQTDGWYLFDQWNASTFDLEASLKTVHIDLWTSAFFTVSLNVDEVDWNKRVVEIDAGGTGMDFYFFLPDFAPYQDVYKEYIRHVALLISHDFGLANNVDRADQFTADVFEVEQTMAAVMLTSPYLNDPHHDEHRLSLAQLTDKVNNTIDFTLYMKELFNEWPNKFNDNTKIVVLRELFFETLGQILSHYLHRDPDGTRKLHNYMMWQLLNRYHHELSWDYVHAKRKFHYMTSGIKDESSGYVYCFSVAEGAMPDAMSAAFIKNFVNKKDQEEGDYLADKIKEELLLSLDSFPWLTDDDRKTAKKKISGSLQKVGYADYMVNDMYMDKMYMQAKITRDDYFGNILALNSLYRKAYNDAIGYASSRKNWVYHVFQPMVTYYNPWHELIVTAAALQNPLFSHKGPAYYNYGGIGTAIARSFIHAIDELGNLYRLDGSNYGSWWSNTTTEKYEETKQCAIETQKGQKLGPFKSIFSPEPYTPNATLFRPYFATTLLAESAALRLSLKTYKKNKAGEALPVGIRGMTADKMFFLAYAQTKCQNTPEYLKAVQLEVNGVFPKEYRINQVVSQVPEFAQAFNCPASSPLVKEKRCMLFP